MSLADELLADLEADEDEENDELPDNGNNHDVPVNSEFSAGDTVPMEQEPEVYSLRDVAKLYRSSRLNDVIERIDYFSSNDRKKGSEDMQGPVEADPEYLLIVEANNSGFNVNIRCNSGTYAKVAKPTILTFDNGFSATANNFFCNFTLRVKHIQESRILIVL